MLTFWLNLRKKHVQNSENNKNVLQNVEMVFCYPNCSDLLWEKNVLVIEKNFRNSRLKAENLQNF